MSTDTARYVVVPCQFCDTRNKVNMERVSHRPKCHNEECGRPILLDRPFPLRDDTFADVIAHAERARAGGLLRRLVRSVQGHGPTLDAIAGELAGRVLVAKVNTDASRPRVAAHQIRSIPTLMVFQRRRRRWRSRWARCSQLLQLLQQAG
jgi:thioredoxin 2